MSSDASWEAACDGHAMASRKTQANHRETCVRRGDLIHVTGVPRYANSITSYSNGITGRCAGELQMQASQA